MTTRPRENAPDGSFLAALSDSEREALRARGQTRRYRGGTVVYHEGDNSDWVVLLDSGRVKVTSLTQDGRDQMLAILGPGELFGELSAFDGEPRSATVTALDAIQAVVVLSGPFRDYLQQCPRVSVLLLETLSGRLRDADRKRVEFGAFDTEGRVARRLLELSERFGERDGDEVRITLPLTQEELAAWVGASREGVSKALSGMRGRGWIDTRRRAITILDTPALRRRAR